MWHCGYKMSAQEIIEGLPKLSQRELEQVDARVHELLRRGNESKSSVAWGTALQEIAGTAKGLPSDFARNHDHYLHGTPRR